MKVTIDHDQFLVTFDEISDTELKYVQHLLTWYNRVGTMKDVVVGSLVQEKLKNKSVAKVTKIFLDAQDKIDGIEYETIKSGAVKTAKGYDVFPVQEETLLWRDNNANWYTYAGFINRFRTDGFTVEVSNPEKFISDKYDIHNKLLDGIELYPYQVSAIKKNIMLGHGLNIMPTSSGKTEVMVAIIKILKDEPGFSCVVAVPSGYLAYQFRKRMKKYGLGDLVGIVNKDHKEYDKPVVVTVYNSIFGGVEAKSLRMIRLLKHCTLFFVDEAHHARSEMLTHSFKYINRKSRFLLFSGSPFLEEQDELFENSGDATIYGLTGGPIVEVDYETLLHYNVIAKSMVHIINIGNATAKFGAQPQKIENAFIVKNRKRNEKLVSAIRKFVKYGFIVMVLVKKKAHAEIFMEALSDLKVFSVFGSESGLDIDVETDEVISVDVDYEQFAVDFEAGKYEVVIGSTVADEGMDLPSMGALVLAGGGKCFGKDTEILMYNGKTKKVQDVVTSDLVMGDDAKPRLVKSTTKGIEQLYEVSPSHGVKWVCNESHNLIFKINTYINKKYKPGNTYIMTVREFLNHPLSSIRKHAVLIRPETFDYGLDQKLLTDAYWVGLWLGDGTYSEGSISCNINDVEIEIWLKQYAAKYNLYVEKRANILSDKCFNFRITGGMLNSQSNQRILNPTWEFLKKYKDMKGKGNKYIPKEYLFASIEDRQKLLAGLIDSDGYVHNKSVEIISVYKRLTDDIVFLARSLGLRVKVSYNERGHSKNSKVQKGKIKRFRISIAGELSHIPTVLPRKQINNRLISKNALHSTFNIKKLEFGEYFGFELDKPTFLLSDFTVVHNSRIKHLQRVGRVKRKKRIGRNVAYIIDTMDKGHIYTLSHSKKRIERYTKVFKSTVIDNEYVFWNLVHAHGEEIKKLKGIKDD